MAAFPVRFSSHPLLHPPPTLPQLSVPYFRCHLSKLALDPLRFSLIAPLSRCFRSSTSWGSTGSALFAVYGDAGEGLPSGYNHNLADTATAVAVEASGVAQLKQALIDTIHDTDRGLTTSSETRGEIVELITQLEAKNPTPAPTEALALLHGRWILAYSSLSELFPLLSAGSLPLVKVGKISQTIDLSDYTFANSVTFTTPLGTASFSATASFQICSPKRVQIMFEEGIIGSPQFTASIEMPESIDFLGQKLDLTQLQGPFQPLQTAAYSIARTISGQPPLKFPLRTDNTQSWLVTTYLDEDLRITRGDGGTVFVLIKEDSPLLE